MSVTYDEIKIQAQTAASELVDAARLQKGDILVVGCSSSEVVGLHIGKGSDINAAAAVYEGIQSVLQPKGIFLAAQCCEHLNRAVIVERQHCCRAPKSSMWCPIRRQADLSPLRYTRMQNALWQ